MQESKNIKSTLDNIIANNDSIFVATHLRPDFDAIGASMGISLIAKKNKKKAYIIINDNFEKLDLEVQKMISAVKKDCEIITSDTAQTLINEGSALIVVDTNKDYLIHEGIKKLLPKFKEVLIIDHHKSDEKTITANNYHIDDKLSSTCEEISRLLFANGVKLTPIQANYLLSGILLDTYKLTKNASAETLKVVSRLCDKGANINETNNMFLEDYESDRKMLRIVSHTEFPTFVYAIACDNEEENKIYQIEDIAKAADYLLKYKIDASFALGYIDEDTISISARSKGKIDVSAVMKLFGGGGNVFSAATRIKNVPIENVKAKLNEILNPTYFIGTNELEESKSLSLTKNDGNN